MTQLVNDVLLIGTAKAGKLNFEPSPMDLVAFCRDIVEDMQISASAAHAQLCGAWRLHQRRDGCKTVGAYHYQFALKCH